MFTYEKMPRINIVFLFDVKRLQNSHYIFIVGCVFNTRMDTRRKTVDYDTLPINFWVAVSAQFPYTVNKVLYSP